MAASHTEEARSLLEKISGMGSSGMAEAEPEDRFLQRFLPLKEHARALDAEVILVIGDRGAGKTELFRAIQFQDGLRSIQELSNRPLPNPNESTWLVGYSSSGTLFPPEGVFQAFAASKSPSELQTVWLGLLLRAIGNKIPAFRDQLPAAVRDPFLTAALKLEPLYDAAKLHLEDCFGVLDSLDRQLSESNSWVFVSYDELDRVSAGDWGTLQTILRGLVQFWSSYVRRWRRLRPKIFLRRDLFSRVALFGPDVSKIAAQRVELIWTPRNLYALLAKRLLNQGQEIRDYFRSVMPAGRDRDVLGWCPTAERDLDYRPFVERICGKFMGATASKGRAFTWIINHLQDGNAQALPRSMVRLFEHAAEIELTNRRADWPRLIHHSSMRIAIDGVSESRVQEIESEEFPWIQRIREKLQSVHPQVPIGRWEIEELLKIDWGGSAARPPDTSPHSLLQFLVELGVFYLRSDGRVDVRDLYLKGFGLKRKGGIARA